MERSERVRGAVQRPSPCRVPLTPTLSPLRGQRERTEYAVRKHLTPRGGASDQAARGRTSRWIFPPLSRRALVKSYIACRFIQNSGLVPKNRASRNAVSAVTDRSPLTIAPMRVAGTRNAMASAFTDRPSGRRNSSLSTSPGCVVTRLGVAIPLVVIDDFDIGRTLLGPNEADAPLVIDADRVLTPAISRPRFQPVRRGSAQVVELAGAMEHVELSQRLFFDAAKSFHKRAHPKPLGGTIAKRFDHVSAIYTAARNTSSV